MNLALSYSEKQAYKKDNSGIKKLKTFEAIGNHIN